ncbi:MAG: hypothetical protein ABIU77_22610 [Ferruginibacter sp.]
MKKLLMILLVACSTGSLFAQNEKQPFLTKSFSGDAVKEVEAITSGGNIDVTSVAAGQERVEVFIWPSNRNKNASVSKEEIQQKLDELYDVKIEVAGNKLTAVVKPKHNNMNWKNSLSVSYKIFVNQNIATHLTTSGGNISLAALSGEQHFTTSGGNIVVDHVKGKLKGTTSGGNIDVKDADDDIEMTTSGGNIDASNCNGKIKLSTSGGNLMLTGLSGDIHATTSGGDVKGDDIKGDLTAHTSGGNVKLAGLSCNVSAGTSGGDVRVAVKEPGKFIKLTNSGGKIDLELPAGKGYNLDISGDKVKTDGLTNFSGKASDTELRGTLNGGGTEVTANAGGSKISLTFK